MIRCTCFYRASTPTEREAGAAALSVSVRDPFCPAADLHTRTAEAAVTADIDQPSRPAPPPPC